MITTAARDIGLGSSTACAEVNIPQSHLWEAPVNAEYSVTSLAFTDAATPDIHPLDSFDLLSSALDYSARGWAVLPLHTPQPGGGCSCGRDNCAHPGKHPRTRNGLLDATTDSETIRQWWQRWPDANVGIACGPSGLVVIDIDPRNGGDESLRALEDQFGHLPLTIEAISGGGGRHIFFANPPGVQVHCQKLARGIDVKADGGYVVAAPSLHASGQRYAWELSCTPDSAGLLPLPDWLLTLLTAFRSQGISSSHPPGWMDEALTTGAEEGQRNNTATSIAGALHRQGVRDDVILQLLSAWNQLNHPPLADSELEAVVHSISRYPIPLRIEAPTRQPGDIQLQLNALPLTDAGQAEAIALLYGDRLRYDCTRKKWLVWDSVRWRLDSDGEAQRLAVKTARDRLTASDRAADNGMRQIIAKFAVRAEDDHRIQSGLRVAAIHPSLATDSAAFDRDPWVLVCGNGLVDLQTGILRASNPSDMVSLTTGIPYEAGAACPRWRQFLNEVFLDDQDLIDYIHRAIGYTLSGDTREQCLFICHGSGANGKSVFLSVLREIMGEYGANTCFDTILDHDRGGRSVPNDVAALRGARLVTASEVKEGARLDEGRIKALTGCDPITARFLFAEYFTYVPAFKLWLAVNHKPTIRGTDEAIWRRIRLIPFNAHFAPDKADPDLTKKLVAEGPGILAWAVQGCLDWLRQGLGIPNAVSAATSTYRVESDLLTGFLSDCVPESPSAQVKASDLYAAYRIWCETNGENAMSCKKFGTHLTERGIGKEHKKTGSYYTGLGLPAPE
jgi:putative DNA primase/helicase